MLEDVVVFRLQAHWFDQTFHFSTGNLEMGAGRVLTDSANEFSLCNSLCLLVSNALNRFPRASPRASPSS